ncbi:hypothetical protein PGTUg99_015081 [Puccinia graminis f. sp. tritici]|uniref:Uncharacterized protein n=1 Tax=Puccinia graminis f. sp. tritici TaxID=56615 RepID=A0A5B0RCF2_PUCGR|nr:hypothetical protein PGTUg99_015081 [Puccinia graminis f. sp. tritici]
MTARSGSVAVRGHCEAEVFQLDELKKATTVLQYKPTLEVENEEEKGRRLFVLLEDQSFMTTPDPLLLSQ